MQWHLHLHLERGRFRVVADEWKLCRRDHHDRRPNLNIIHNIDDEEPQLPHDDNFVHVHDHHDHGGALPLSLSDAGRSVRRRNTDNLLHQWIADRRLLHHDDDYDDDLRLQFFATSGRMFRGLRTVRRRRFMCRIARSIRYGVRLRWRNKRKHIRSLFHSGRRSVHSGSGIAGRWSNLFRVMRLHVLCLFWLGADESRSHMWGRLSMRCTDRWKSRLRRYRNIRLRRASRRRRGRDIG